MFTWSFDLFRAHSLLQISRTVGNFLNVFVSYYLCLQIMDDIPMHNHAAEGEMHPFKSINNQQTGRHQEPDRGEQEESTDPPLAPTMEADPAAKTGEQSALKSCLASDFHVPKNKRKRGERKAGSAGWNR